MAGTGPAPKPGPRHGHSKPTHGPERVLTDTGQVYGPEPIPGWSPPVLAWYETWRQSPQAALFEDTDWIRLLMLAPMVERAFAGGIAAMTEVRMNESLLGATVVDRLKARIRVDRDESASLASVSNLPSAREGLRSRLS